MDAVTALCDHPGFPSLSLNTHSQAFVLTVLPLTVVTCSPSTDYLWATKLPCSAAWRLDCWKCLGVLTSQGGPVQGLIVHEYTSPFPKHTNSNDYYHRHILKWSKRHTFLHFYMFDIGCTLQLTCRTLIGNVFFS